jgi:putative transposase
MNMSPIRLCRTVTRLAVHMVWATRDRRPCLEPEIDPWLSKLIVAKCAQIGCRAIAVGNASDHVHALVTFPPTLAVASIAHRLEGASSHRLSSRLPQLQWQAGSFAESVSDIARAAAYVLHPRQYHDHAAPGAQEPWETTLHG